MLSLSLLQEPKNATIDLSEQSDSVGDWQIQRVDTESPWSEKCPDNGTFSFMFEKFSTSYGDEYLTMWSLNENITIFSE